jgi:cell division transport system permease protein
MMLDKLVFLLAEGIKNLWRHKLTAFAAVFSVFLSLLFVGSLIIASQNVHKIIEYFRSKYKIEVFFTDATTQARAEQLVKEFRSIPGVRSTTLITKKDAVRIFKSQFGENILDLLGYNPLPISCVINVVRDKDQLLRVDPIIDKLKTYKEVETVNYQGALIYRIESLFQRFLKLTLVLSIIVIGIAVIIISNTLRLTIYAKKDLIQALQLIGATRSFVKAPFVIEGMLQGLLGSLLAGGVLIAGMSFVNQISKSLIAIEFQYDPIILLVWLLGLGVFISFIGASRATSRFLK